MNKLTHLKFIYIHLFFVALMSSLSYFYELKLSNN